MTSRMKLSTKLIGSVGTILGLAILLGTCSALVIRGLNQSMDYAVNVAAARRTIAHEIYGAALKMQSLDRAIMLRAIMQQGAGTEDLKQSLRRHRFGGPQVSQRLSGAHRRCQRPRVLRPGPHGVRRASQCAPGTGRIHGEAAVRPGAEGCRRARDAARRSGHHRSQATGAGATWPVCKRPATKPNRRLPPVSGWS